MSGENRHSCTVSEVCTPSTSVTCGQPCRWPHSEECRRLETSLHAGLASCPVTLPLWRLPSCPSRTEASCYDVKGEVLKKPGFDTRRIDTRLRSENFLIKPSRRYPTEGATVATSRRGGSVDGISETRWERRASSASPMRLRDLGSLILAYYNLSFARPLLQEATDTTWFLRQN
ncbi:hypothetical protein N656DRAFT_549983 [Canariomyces notabilis]|uniref:Uncharacterized protein n=1 Tax=Canariomyces notabilis TaxID=2074819 RepID=A0AAN6TI20_9PEZI|nr:hypothetical protein N656DRAFT_549983 [Canariomyces arenarius]